MVALTGQSALIASVQALAEAMGRQAAAQAQQHEQPQQSERTRRLGLAKVDPFSGITSEYDDWAFTFKKVVKTHEPRAYDLLMFAEQSPPDSPDTEADLAARGYPGDVRLSAELYDLLCMSVKGEALAIVRGCHDMLGFVAWRKLHQK
jgi:hypothetical protein